MKRTSLFLLLLLSLAACGDPGYLDEPAVANEDTSVPSAEGAAAPGQAARVQAVGAADTVGFETPAPGTVPGMAAVSLNPMLVRTGRATVQVDSLEEGITRVRAIARRVGGIVGNTTISAGTDQARRAEMEMRIPSLNFDAAAAELSSIGTVQSVGVTAEDVGEEYTDVSARVVNARRMETRLLELLATRSGRLEEALSLEREVARVREEIERYEGRLRYLRTRASVSVLTLTLHEGQSPLGAPPGERPIRDAFATAWRSFVDMLAGVIASLGVLIPLGLMSWLAWRTIRRYQHREDAREALYREKLRRERAAPAPGPAEAEEPVGSGAGNGPAGY